MIYYVVLIIWAGSCSTTGSSTVKTGPITILATSSHIDGMVVLSS